MLIFINNPINRMKIKQLSLNTERPQVGNTFDVGSRVQISGTYICVPCGYTCTFKKRTVFPRCFNCLVGKKYKGDDYIKDLGLWEYLG